MNTYRIEYESRMVGAIGEMERGIDIVRAESEKEAKENFRNSFDYEKREHLLIRKAVKVSEDY